MNVNCPLCRETNFEVIYKNLPDLPEIKIVCCNSCKHIYTNYKTEPDAEYLYSNDVYKITENRQTTFDKILNLEYRKLLKKINRLKPGKGSLLDFGSGKGRFANLANEMGWQVKCVETSRQRAEYSREKYRLNVNTKPYSSGNIFNDYFKVLTLFHVLEHLPEPVTVMKELIKHNLEKDALIVVEVPNFNSWQSSFAASKWLHLDASRHYSHFTPERLEQFISELGFKTVKTTYFSFHLGVLGMVDCLLKRIGYKKNIIYELKNKKNRMLLVAILLLLPFAFVIEFIAALFDRGGIIRKYFH